ncbi:ArsR family transcriptional regulator [Trinickia symbiotica]|uniref:ArsR family transcriptional regulator n=1 Tax=Trinickia symbiotica TaxID=863227 RepID=A0A2N7WRU8_9BURK|nr:metalloregulator ArsR/SmtB family transcription factor [Trinickia symbiotica]PMS32159.1 ArsR family transcriptional regulator [Trinickia symbiotica]PPK41960.1 ArsR family transcriptional regulator [Trinickia symbiotica]PTB17320.1 ArsR family transcriptional regulator [Trinickia symbiotica]
MRPFELSDDQVTELSEMFRLMGDPTRLKIIVSCLSAPMCVTDIAAKHGLSQPLVSHHLRLLRAARVLRAERRGKQIFYEAADEHVKRVIGDMADHVCEHPGSEFEESAKEA